MTKTPRNSSTCQRHTERQGRRGGTTNRRQGRRLVLAEVTPAELAALLGPDAPAETPSGLRKRALSDTPVSKRTSTRTAQGDAVISGRGARGASTGSAATGSSGGPGDWKVITRVRVRKRDRSAEPSPTQDPLP